MPEPAVTVHVNRTGANSLEPTAETVATSHPFEVALQGHETPAHVHCRLGSGLERVATLAQTNYYVEPDDVTAVRIGVDTEAIDGPLEGQLELLAGYGSESVSLSVTVEPGPQPVDVDDSLAEPSRPPAESTPADRIGDRLAAASGLEPGTIAVLALGLVAIGIAAATAGTIGGPVAMVGLAVVVVGVAVALGLLLW